MTASRHLILGRMPLDDRIADFLFRFGTEPCWIWPGKPMANGYAHSTIPAPDGGKGVFVYVHSYAHEKLIGPIPAGLVHDHLCRHRNCFDPWHLEPVTNRENILRGTGASARCARKTHCPRGHPYEGENLILRPNGFRRCRTCDAEIAPKRDRKSEAWYKKRELQRAVSRLSARPVGAVDIRA